MPENMRFCVLCERFFDGVEPENPEAYKEQCVVNWHRGEEVVIPSEEECAELPDIGLSEAELVRRMGDAGVGRGFPIELVLDSLDNTNPLVKKRAQEKIDQLKKEWTEETAACKRLWENR